jgi:hypothetical protein
MQGEISKMWPLIWQYIHILHRYTVCSAFQLHGKKQHMTIVRIFFLPFFKVYFVFS